MLIFSGPIFARYRDAFVGALERGRIKPPRASAIDDSLALQDQLRFNVTESEHTPIGWLSFDWEGKGENATEFGLDLRTIDGLYVERHHFVFGEPRPDHAQPSLFTPNGLSIRLSGPEEAYDVLNQFTHYALTQFRWLNFVGHDVHQDTLTMDDFCNWTIPDLPNIRVFDTQKIAKAMEPELGDKGLADLYSHYRPITAEEKKEMHFHGGLNDAKYTNDILEIQADRVLAPYGKTRPYARPPLSVGPFIYVGGVLVDIKKETPSAARNTPCNIPNGNASNAPPPNISKAPPPQPSNSSAPNPSNPPPPKPSIAPAPKPSNAPVPAPKTSSKRKRKAKNARADRWMKGVKTLLHQAARVMGTNGLQNKQEALKRFASKIRPEQDDVSENHGIDQESEDGEEGNDIEIDGTGAEVGGGPDMDDMDGNKSVAPTKKRKLA